MWYQTPYQAPPATMLETIAPVSPVYIILIVGMVIFAASNAMRGLLPDPSKLGHLAPFVLQWGFLIVILALLATMTGLLPGVPSLHITYVHMACAGILFGLMWNHIVANNFPDPPKKSSSSGSSPSSSSSSSRSKESSSSSSSSSSSKPKESKSSSSSSSSSKEKSGTTSGSPWDDLRAHPSAFLTTRMNRLMPWPFPMGKATPKGSEVWWESGTPSHVGHYNKPTQLETPGRDPKKEGKEGSSSKSDSPASSDSKEKKKKEESSKERSREEESKRTEQKEREQPKPQSGGWSDGKGDSRHQETNRERVKEKDEQRAKEKDKEKESMMHQQRTKPGVTGEEDPRTAADPRVSSSKSTQPQAQNAMTGDRETRKFLRTKFLVLIAGLSLVDKTLGFFLLLFYTIRLLAQELNGTEVTEFDNGRGMAGGPSKLGPGQSGREDAAAQAAKLERAKTLREAQAAQAKDEDQRGGSSTGPSSSERPKDKEQRVPDQASKSEGAPVGENPKSPSSSAGKEEKSASRSSSESKEKSSSSSSSSSSKDTITSAAVREEAGSKTETKAQEQPVSAIQPVGMGMHYIYQHGGGTELESGPCFIPSEGMSHPLMTTLSKHWAN